MRQVVLAVLVERRLEGGLPQAARIDGVGDVDAVGVLALLIGIRLLVWGVLQLAIAFQLRSLTN